MIAPMEVTVRSTDQKLGYTAAMRDHPPVTIDYFPPLGEGKGYTPLELLLISLASCSGGTLGLLLRKTGKKVDAIEVKAHGTRRDPHPTSFRKIVLSFTVKSDDVTGEDVQKAIQLAEESVCPVWAMVKGNAEVVTEFRIIAC
jgi:putative redox protein